MSGKTDRRITFLSLTTAALPPDGSGGSLGAVCRAVVSVSIPKVPISSRDPSLFSPIVRHPQASHNKPRPDSLFRIKRNHRFSSLYACFWVVFALFVLSALFVIPKPSAHSVIVELGKPYLPIANLEVAFISVELGAHPHPLATCKSFVSCVELNPLFLLPRLFRLSSQLAHFYERKQLVS